jgi:flagellar biosynthesis/type III secretory pathway chaperone
METKKLFELLVNQLHNLHSLKEVMIEQQKAIVKNVISEVEKAVEEEERILNRIRNNERDRINEIVSLAGKEGISLETPSVNEFLKIMKTNNDPNYETIFKVRNQIILLAYEINNLNQQNSYLIEHSRKFIKDTITALYGANQHKIFDRKI